MQLTALLLATFAAFAVATPTWGEHDYNDKNWGKDKCYKKHVTYYKTYEAYKTKTEWERAHKTEHYVEHKVTHVPKTIEVTKQRVYETHVPVYKKHPYHEVKKEVKEEKVCKTKWYGDHWDYDNKGH